MKNYCLGKFGAVALAAASLILISAYGYGQTFTVAASPSSLTIYPGQQNIAVPVTVGAVSGGYSGPVVVTMTGLPSGVSATPLTLTPGSSGSLILNASPSAGQEGFSVDLPSSTPVWTSTATLVGAAGSVQARSPFSVTISISNPSFTPNTVNLPVVRIDTNNVPIVDKTTNVPGTISITSADGTTSYLPSSSSTDNTATFHVHGNSTQYMPKQPYNVKLHTSMDLLSAMGLNCGYTGKTSCDKSKSYILLANYDDKTLLRDWSASALANAIPYGGDYFSPTPVPSGYSGTIPTPSGTSTLMPWAPHSLFVELYINGEYKGNYQLIEKVNLDSHRININELSETDTGASQITGGYLMEADQRQDEAYVFQTPHNLPIGLKDPDFSPDPQIPEQTTYITNYVNTAETALFSNNFTDPALGWRAYFDEASAINFYIVNDVMGNQDGGAFYSSVYFYKDQNNPFLYMGPIWDFDISSGNVNYSRIVNPTVPWMQTAALWYEQLFKDPGFRADVAKQWNTLKKNGVFDTWLASIQTQAGNLQLSQANNNARWPMQGLKIFPNPEAAGSYDGEVSYYTNWLKLRIAYLDSIFNGKTGTTTTLGVPSGTLRSGVAVALSAQVTGGTSPTGSVSFLANGMLLGTAPLSGNSASLSTNGLPAGSDSLQAVYSGDDTNALSASDPQSANVAGPLVASATSLALTSSNVTSATPASFSVSVLGDSGTAIPTGSVTLTSGTASLGSATLAADGTATISATLSSGTDSVQAVYSGDVTYQGSTSNPISVDVAPPPDFSFVGSPSSVPVSGKTPGSVTLTVTPQNGFNQSVSFSCGALPAGIACAFSPQTVTPSGNAVTTTMTLSLPTRSSRTTIPLWRELGGGIMVCLLLWPFRRRRFRMLLAVAAILIVGSSIIACGSSGDSDAPHSTTYPLTVTANSGGITHTVSLSCTVTE